MPTFVSLKGNSTPFSLLDSVWRRCRYYSD